MKLLFRVLAAWALATGFAPALTPVSDITAIPRWAQQAVDMANQLQRLRDQYEKMKEQYDKTVDIFDTAVDTYNSITGGRGLAFLRNGAFESGIRRFIPEDIYALRALRTGAPNRPGAFGATGFWAQTLKNGYGLPESDVAFRNSQADSTPYGRQFAYRETMETAQSSMAAANTSHFATEQRLVIIEDVLKRMEQGGRDSNDLKRAVDNNTRMSAEVAFLLTEMIRMQAQQNYLSGAEAHDQLTQQAARARVISFRSYRSR